MNSSKYEVDDKFDKIVEAIPKAYSIEDKIYKIYEKDDVIFRVSHSEALEALQTF